MITKALGSPNTAPPPPFAIAPPSSPPPQFPKLPQAPPPPNISNILPPVPPPPPPIISMSSPRLILVTGPPSAPACGLAQAFTPPYAGSASNSLLRYNEN